jgi:hypothetical protein
VRGKDLTIPAAFKYVKISRDHACEGCQKIIPKGSRVLNVHGRVGFWFNEYWCDRCDVDRITSIPNESLKKSLFEKKAQLTVDKVMKEVSVNRGKTK